MRLFVVTVFAVLALASPAFAARCDPRHGRQRGAQQRRRRARPTTSSKLTTATSGVSGDQCAHPPSRSRPARRFADWAAGPSRVGATAGRLLLAATDLNVDCSLSGSNTIAAGTAVTVTVEASSNPATAVSSPSSTTADARRADHADLGRRARRHAHRPGGDNTPTPTAVGARRADALPSQFTTSATGALSEQANSRIDVTFPTGHDLRRLGRRDAHRRRHRGRLLPAAHRPCCRMLARQRPDDRRRHDGQHHLRRRHQPRVQRHLQRSPPRRTRRPEPARHRRGTAGGSPALAVSDNAPTTVARAPALPDRVHDRRRRGALAGGQQPHQRHLPDAARPSGWAGGHRSRAAPRSASARAHRPRRRVLLYTGRTIDANTPVTITFGRHEPGRDRHVQRSRPLGPAGAERRPSAAVAPHDLTGLTVANGAPTTRGRRAHGLPVGFTTSSTRRALRSGQQPAQLHLPGRDAPSPAGPAGRSPSPARGGLLAGCADACHASAGSPAGRTIAASSRDSASSSTGVTNAPSAAAPMSVSTTSDPTVAEQGDQRHGGRPAHRR